MKLVPEFLYEKFTEDDIDPIRSMGIGLADKLSKMYPWVRPEAKDIMRINDIIKKANGDVDKENRLATTMSKLITDEEKAYRRYLAAKKIGGDNWEVTNIFLSKALELNNVT